MITTTTTKEAAVSADQDQVILVMEEALRVEKREVESGRARVHVTVSEHDQAIETMLTRRDLSIERVPVGREVDAAPPSRLEGDVLIVPVMEEIAVVVKRLVLKEELRIRVDTTRHLDTQVVRLRREHADIELDGNAVELAPHEPHQKGSIP